MLVYFKGLEHAGGISPMVIAPSSITVQDLRSFLDKLISESKMVRVDSSTKNEMQIKQVERYTDITDRTIDKFKSDAAMTFQESFVAKEEEEVLKHWPIPPI